MTVIERMYETLKNQNKKITDLCKFLGISNSIITNWKRRNAIPPAEYIVKICEFLDVSCDYFLTGIEDTFNDDEIKILSYYRKLSEENKDLIKGEMVKLQKEQEAIEAVKKMPKKA